MKKLMTDIRYMWPEMVSGCETPARTQPVRGMCLSLPTIRKNSINPARSSARLIFNPKEKKKKKKEKVSFCVFCCVFFYCTSEGAMRLQIFWLSCLVIRTKNSTSFELAILQTKRIEDHDQTLIEKEKKKKEGRTRDGRRGLHTRTCRPFCCVGGTRAASYSWLKCLPVDLPGTSSTDHQHNPGGEDQGRKKEKETKKKQTASEGMRGSFQSLEMVEMAEEMIEQLSGASIYK